MSDDMINRDDFARVVGIYKSRIEDLENAVSKIGKAMPEEERACGSPLSDSFPETSDAIFEALELGNFTRTLDKGEAIKLGDPDVNVALLEQARRERDRANEALRDINRITFRRGQEDAEDLLDEVESRASEGLGK